MDDQKFGVLLSLPLAQDSGQREFDLLSEEEQRAIWVGLALAIIITQDARFNERDSAIIDSITASQGAVPTEAMRPLVAYGINAMRDRVGAAHIENYEEHIERVLTPALNLLAEAHLPGVGPHGAADWYEDCWSAAQRAMEAAGYNRHDLEGWVSAAASLVRD